MKNAFPCLISLVLACLLSGCSILDKQVQKAVDRNLTRNTKSKATLDTALRDFGQNAMLGANKEVATLVNTLLQSLKNSVDTLDPALQKAFIKIDSLSNVEVIRIGQAVLEQIRQVKGEIKDEELKRFFVEAIEETVGKLDKQTQIAVIHIIDSTLAHLNSDASLQKFAAIRDSLLNESTKRQLQETVRRSLQPTIDTLSNRVDQIVHKNLPIVQRFATEFLIGLGTVSIIIMSWIWYQRRKYLQLSKLLTYQIDKIPDQKSYDDLVKRIQNLAKQESLEPLLREVLQKQGINH